MADRPTERDSLPLKFTVAKYINYANGRTEVIYGDRKFIAGYKFTMSNLANENN